MIYNEIFYFLNYKTVVLKKTINDILNKKVESFQDEVDLYIETASYLKYYDIRRVNHDGANRDDSGRIIQFDFNINGFHKIFLKEGMNILQHDFIKKSLIDAVIYLERHLESRLHSENPQLEYFKNLIADDYSVIKYIFTGFNPDELVLFRYFDSTGNLKEIVNRNQTKIMTKESVLGLMDQESFDPKLKLKLLELSEGRPFPELKKAVVLALELYHKGEIPEEDIEFKEILKEFSKRNAMWNALPQGLKETGKDIITQNDLSLLTKKEGEVEEKQGEE